MLDLNKKILPVEISAHITYADALIRAGRYKDAAPILALLLKIAEKSLPSDHLYKANIIIFYSYVNAMLGVDLKQATQDSLNAQAILKKLLHEKGYYKNRHVYMSYRFLGEIYKKQANYSKAKLAYAMSLAIVKNIHSDRDYAVIDDLSDLYSKLAIISVKLKQPIEAIEYFKLQTQVFDIKHPRSIRLMEYFVGNNVDLGF